MLVKTIYDAATLQNEFISMNRDYFSYEGYEALIELFEECSPQPVELDVIAICCEFNESSPEDIMNDYSNIFVYDPESTEDLNEQIIDFINYYSWGVELSNGNILYQSF